LNPSAGPTYFRVPQSLRETLDQKTSSNKKCLKFNLREGLFNAPNPKSIIFRASLVPRLPKRYVTSNPCKTKTQRRDRFCRNRLFQHRAIPWMSLYQRSPPKNYFYRDGLFPKISARSINSIKS
jgi:hypothetical protein